MIETKLRAEIGLETGICIHHLSHVDASQWIEKANRYTSQPDRVRAQAEDGNLAAFAHQRIDHWVARTKASDGADYPAAVALLRAVYDMIDRVKVWETDSGLDGAARFAARCADLNDQYDELSRRLNIPTQALPWFTRLRARWRRRVAA